MKLKCHRYKKKVEITCFSSVFQDTGVACWHQHKGTDTWTGSAVSEDLKIWIAT